MTGDAARLDRAAALALARRARRLLVKTREGIVRADVAPSSADDLARWLVHPDGYLNVPILLVDDLLVRGYTPEMYEEALGS
ncbi:MAG: hypothetical protein HY216_05820 [Candidatus Rokubacteria bacterium]|nr:hypothetical protein [Candidatus Rokubacteria bacterium]